MKSEITGIILAGGQSKRMGTNKAFVPLNGKLLIDYAFDVLTEVTPHIVMSVGTEIVHYKNLAAVQDIFPGSGPLGGIHSALQHSETEMNLVLSCDMPFVSVELLQFLIEEATKNQSDVTLPVDEHGDWQPLCAVYRKRILPHLENAILQKEFKLKMVIGKVNYNAISIGKVYKFYHPNAFLNMNTPEDIKVISKKLKSY
ncbi:MAG: molybdenum cofactor guanylyltransferase [Mangrovibacterium sp.]